MVPVLSSSIDKELLGSRSRGHASCNGPAISAGIYLKFCTNVTHEDIIETTYYIENLREIFDRSCEEQAVGTSGDSCPESPCMHHGIIWNHKGEPKIFTDATGY